MVANDKRLQEILSVLERHSAMTGLSIETHIESLVIFLAERGKGKTFEEAARSGINFLDESEKRQLLCSNITTAAIEQNFQPEV